MNTTITNLTSLLVLLPIFLFGQEGTHYTITNENGESLPFATVAFYKDGALIGGTISDLDGKVTLTIEAVDSILISYVGHQQKSFTTEEILTSETLSLSSSTTSLTTVEVIALKNELYNRCPNICYGSTVTRESTQDSVEIKEDPIPEIIWKSYPNPTSRYVQVENSSGITHGTIRVINTLGSTIFEFPYVGSQTIDLIDYPKGMYYINHFYKDKNVNIARVIKSDVF